jgi:acyl dehydratase
MPNKYIGKYFEEFEIGETFETPARTITEADLVNFTGVSWDIHPLHNDEVHCQTTIYGRRIAHGFLILSIMGGLTTCSGVMDRGLGFLGMDGWRFHKPVYPGDTIRCRIQVISKKVASSGSRGIVTFQREIRNQRDETVQTGQTLHMFAMRPK